MRHNVRLTSLALAVAVLGAAPALAQTQSKELSEKSVTTLMNYAWSILPAKFTAPTGKIIEVDKKKRDALVPVDVARDVIKVGNISAQAQLCDLLEEQVANYQSMMAREIAKKKWTDQQLLYITTLHRMTVHMAAGKLRVVEKGADEAQVLLEPIEPSKDTCSDEKKGKVKDAIQVYVKASPQPSQAPTQQGVSPAATQPVQPVPAAAKNSKK